MIIIEFHNIANSPCYVIKLEKKRIKKMEETKIIVTLSGADKVGIVAALTLPNAIANWKNKYYQSSLKKAITILSKKKLKQNLAF